MDKVLPNFNSIDSREGRVYGLEGYLTNVNPYKCYFVVSYPDGSIVKGNNLFTTGWDSLVNGITNLSYVLSTGHVINIPKFRAYLPLIEISHGIDGSRIFHAINVKCLGDKEVLIYKIILKETNKSKFKIGDVLISKEPLPDKFSNSWKFTNF